MRSQSLYKAYDTISTRCSDSFLQHPFYQRQYLIQKGSLMMHDLHYTRGQKAFYENKLNIQMRNITDDKQRLLKTVSDKSVCILHLQQQLEKQRRQVRLLTEDNSALKVKFQQQQQRLMKQIEDTKIIANKRMLEIQAKLLAEHQQNLERVVNKIKQECEYKLKLKETEIQVIKSSRQSINIELQKAVRQYEELLLKQADMKSEQLHNELRKRDRQQRERLNLDKLYKSSIKKQNKQLKGEIEQKEKQICSLNNKIKEQGLNMNCKTKNKLRLRKNSTINDQNLKFKHGHPFSDNVLPLLNIQLFASLQSLKQFIDEHLIIVLLELYERSSSQSGKVQSGSLNIFQVNTFEIKKQRHELFLIMYTSCKLKQIMQSYYPSELDRNIELCTQKQKFIKQCLQQCQYLNKKPLQQLFRLLELVYRIKNPIDHSQTISKVSNTTMYELYDKAIQSGYKVFK